MDDTNFDPDAVNDTTELTLFDGPTWAVERSQSIAAPPDETAFNALTPLHAKRDFHQSRVDIALLPDRSPIAMDFIDAPEEQPQTVYGIDGRYGMTATDNAMFSDVITAPDHSATNFFGQTIYGGSDNNNLTGTVCSDTIYGGNGNDTINYTYGAGRMYSGDGDDIFRFNPNITLPSSTWIYGGSGFNKIVLYGFGVYDFSSDIAIRDIDRIEFNNASSNAAGSFTLILGTDEITTDEELDDVAFWGFYPFTITYNLIFNQTTSDNMDLSDMTFTNFFPSTVEMNGDGANNTMSGGSRSDTIYGNGGDDSIVGNAGADPIYGGAGNDTIDLSFVYGTLYGGSGDDILLGGSSGDTLYGDDDTDTLYGDDGDDTLYGGNGTDNPVRWDRRRYIVRRPWR